MTKPTIYIAFALFAMIGSISCTRTFDSFPRDDQHLLPDPSGLGGNSDSILVQNTIDYLKELQFGLATNEAEQINNKFLRDSLKERISRVETFADNNLLFAINSIGQKRYIYGKDRVAQFFEKGYLDKSTEKTSVVVDNFIHNDEVSVFNFQAFTNIKDWSIRCGGIDYLDFSDQHNLSDLYIKQAKKGITIDLSNVEGSYTLRLDTVSNFTLKTNSNAAVFLDLRKNSQIKSLEDLDLHYLNQLWIQGKLADNKLFKKLNPTLKNIYVEFGHDAVLGEDGLVYRQPLMDQDFVESLNKYCPSLESLSFTFYDMESFLNADFSQLKLPNLRYLELTMKEGSTYKKQPGSSRVFNLSGCPNLKKFIMEGMALNDLDLKSLTTKANPKLIDVTVTADVDRLVLPNNGSDSLEVTLALLNTKEIIVPNEARGKMSVEMNKFYEPNSPGRLVHDGVYFDWEELRLQLKHLSGYYNSVPPSLYIPKPGTTEKIEFSGTIFDFSGDQWKDFKGLVDMNSRSYDSSKNPVDQIQYIDFGHLKKENLYDHTIVVSRIAVVKNVPEGILIERR